MGALEQLQAEDEAGRAAQRRRAGRVLVVVEVAKRAEEKRGWRQLARARVNHEQRRHLEQEADGGDVDQVVHVAHVGVQPMQPQLAHLERQLQ